ncbi:hypothetical protein [Acidianus ambivalens]|uniref:Uncharacterized protein n=1 Tax=Acidianus ambivalens TaxID=2283 RepID=A0A650CTZ9_ACIAM|nr:hypothetical protein [Acidianus ambivalens]MQL56182.1 hypothetical protein [Acidianus ambivalens]QGR21278.1 hypothetical protein D1866_04160 [Acidianus ambivalens]
MPILKINSGGINDKGCYFEMEKEDVNIFLDFEIIFNGLNGKVKEEMVRRGGSNEHCDAISISQNMIKIHELR